MHAQNSGGTGEHVIPLWLWKDVMGDGPYGREKNGVPAKNKAGKKALRPLPTPEHIKLDCCGPCNTKLNVRFEVALNASVKKAFSGVDLSAGEAESAALWLLKTCLLLVHPSTKTGWEIDQIAWENNPDQYEPYSWMINENDSPSDLSLFIHRFSPSRQDGAFTSMALPHLIGTKNEVRCQGALIGLKEWGFTLVHHPGWSFQHPFDTDPTIVRIWPPQGTLNFTKIQARPNWPLSFHEGSVFLNVEQMADAILPPLTVETRFDEIPGYVGMAGMPPVV
ncbi:hypothetical protein [Paeniglutamicibacter sp. ORCA_105]|uniref:hypothetical protein n=1 Tax=Paeniglutamicibacter sp. ORCA_105 TaxID=3377336 RepID=UPI003896B56E